MSSGFFEDIGFKRSVEKPAPVEVLPPPPPPEPTATEVQPAKQRKPKSQLEGLRIPRVSGGSAGPNVGY